MSADDEADMREPFSAEVDGISERPSFGALVDAMAWVEKYDEPTGVVRYLGAAVVLYDRGNVDTASTPAEPTPAPRRPVFIVSTEGKTPDQMKADAREALANFRRAAED